MRVKEQYYKAPIAQLTFYTSPVNLFAPVQLFTGTNCPGVNIVIFIMLIDMRLMRYYTHTAIQKIQHRRIAILGQKL